MTHFCRNRSATPPLLLVIAADQVLDMLLNPNPAV